MGMETKMDKAVGLIKMHRDSLSARVPKKGHEADGAFDVTCTRVVEGGFFSNRVVLETDLRMLIPEGFRGQLWSRSGNARKRGWFVEAGLIDSGYTGTIQVVLTKPRFSPVPDPGERVAQLTIDRVEPFILMDTLFHEWVDVLTEHSPERGDGGFGSTGH